MINAENIDIASPFTNYSPAYSNLFEIQIYNSGAVVSSKDSSEKELYPTLHATSIVLGGERLSLERHPVTKHFCVTNNHPFTLQDTMTITWRESDSWCVRKYHEDWLKSIYDRSNDQFKSQQQPGNIYRDFLITLPTASAPPTFVFEAKTNSQNSNTIFVEKAIPQNTGDLSLEWSTSPGIVTHSITYYIEDWSWYNS